MRLIGLDPGLRLTGWGVLDVAGNRLPPAPHGVIRVSPEAPLAAAPRFQLFMEDAFASPSRLWFRGRLEGPNVWPGQAPVPRTQRTGGVEQGLRRRVASPVGFQRALQFALQADAWKTETGNE